MLAREMIDRLERLGWLDQEIIEALRDQLEQGGARVTPEAVAKLLVDNGQLTRFQATKLIGELRSGDREEAERSLDEEPAADLTLVDESASEESAAAGSAAASARRAAASEPAEAVESVAVQEPVAVEVATAGPARLDDPSVGFPGDRPPRRKRTSGEPEKSVWDSFKVYGYLGIIVLLLLAGGGLWFMLSRADAEDFIARANELYQREQYQPAQDSYIRFLSSFGQDHKYSSLARTRITLAELYRAEQLSDPTRGLEVAQEKLPEIEEEEFLNQERPNLAALLVDIADRIASKAVKAEATGEKQALLDRLDEQMRLMENPLYMTAQLRAQLAGRLSSVAEARARVQRDIHRNESLDKAVEAMVAALDERQTKQAYDIRTALLREFPELHDHRRLGELVARASEIQQELVSPSTKLPKRVEATVSEDALRSVVLTTREGGGVPGLEGQAFFLRAGGSVLAFAADDGRLLWRRFTGYGEDDEPIRLGDGDGVLLSDSRHLELQRCRGADGSVEWRASLEEPFSRPVVGRGTVYLSTPSGRVVAVDGETGDARWVTQIPQAVEISPGIDPRGGRAYQPGDHSNLYVLDSRDGSCLESYYVGHREGTIAVPPVSLLGHLFVIENAAADYARVHVLKSDEQGQNLVAAQPDFRLSGNVTVAPVVAGRRLIVLTDRGQVMVFDVEPSAEGKQVTTVAELVASYNRPTATRMAVDRNQMWVTGSRIGRYELQINTGRIVADWGKYAGDQFLGQPLALDEAVLTARVLRDSTAIRVTAIAPKSGQELWRTDVGVPVAMITPVAGEKKFHAVTSQGALFELDADSFTSGSTKSPLENPGGKGIAMRFEQPIEIDETKRLLMNRATPGEILVYDPDRRREKLRKLQLLLPGGRPAGDSVVAGGGLFVPLDSGRAVLMNWNTGGLLGSPFQPASEPSVSVRWTTPIPLPDDPEQLVIADSRQKLYRLRAGDQIRELSQVDLETPLLGPAAVIGGTMVASSAGPSADYLVGYHMADLRERFRRLLDGRVDWGPVSGGDRVWIRTDDGTLRGFDESGNATVEVTLPPGRLVGEPVEVGRQLVFAGRRGWLIAIDPDTGDVQGSIDLGQPISATPLPLPGERLLVPGEEGLIYLSELEAQ